MECEFGGDITNDCEGCAYSGDYHFEKGQCIKRGGEQMRNGTDLIPIYDSRKSFYGKAKVSVNYDSDTMYLHSYGTLVAMIRNGKAEVFGIYSATTLRHIKEFLKQHGFEASSQKQIEKDYHELI